MSKIDDILKALEQDNPLEEEQSDQGWSYRRGRENAREFTTEIPEIDTRGVTPDEGPWEDSWGKRIARGLTGLEDIIGLGLKGVGTTVKGRAEQEEKLYNDFVRDIYEKAGRGDEAPNLTGNLANGPQTVGEVIASTGDYLFNRAHSPEREKAFRPNNRWQGTDFLDLVKSPSKLADYMTDTGEGFLYDLPYNLGNMAGFLLPTKAIPGGAANSFAGKILNPASGLLGRLGYNRAADVIGSKAAREALGASAQFGATMGPYGAMVNSGTIIDELKKQGKSDAEIADAIGELFREELPADIAFAALTGNVVKGKLGNMIAPRGSSLGRKIAANAAGIPLESAGGYLSNVNQMILSEKYSGQPYGELFGEHTPAEKQAGLMGAMAGVPFAIYGGGRGVVDARAADKAYERFQKYIAEGKDLREAALSDMPQMARDAYRDAQNEYSSNNLRALAQSEGVPDNVYNLIMRIAQEEGVPPERLLAQAIAESNGNQDDISHTGAIGVMQLMPDTARELGVDPYDLEQNIRGGARYLKQQYDATGDWTLAHAAYNAGLGAVQKFGGVPYGEGYEETQPYVDRINGLVSGRGGESGGGRPPIDIQSGLNSARKALDGKQMDNSTVGCVEAVTKILAHVHPEFQKMVDDGVVNTVEGENSLYSRLEKMGVKIIPFDEANVAPGDIIFYDGKQTYQHVLVADHKDAGGNWRVFGNSSSANKVMEQPLYQGQTPSWIAKVSNISGGKSSLTDRPTIQQRADELFDQRFRERVSPQRQEQPQPPEPMQARQIDFKATDDETKSVFDGFAKEQANKAIADGDGEKALFFLDMFNGDEFQNTPENRAAIAKRYGDELTQFAQTFTPTLPQTTEQAQPVSVSAPRPQAQPAANGTANKYVRNNDVIQAGNNFLEELRAKGNQADMATTVRLQAAISNGDTATVESILKANNRPVAVQQPQQPQQQQQQQQQQQTQPQNDPVKQNGTPENVLTQQQQPQQQEATQPQQPAKPKKQPKTPEERAQSYLAKPLQGKKSQKVRRRAGNAVIFLADNNGIEIPDADRKSLEHGKTKVINQWRDTLIGKGILSSQTTQQPQQTQPSQPQQQAQPANKPLTLQDRMQQVVNEAGQQSWQETQDKYRERAKATWAQRVQEREDEISARQKEAEAREEELRARQAEQEEATRRKSQEEYDRAVQEKQERERQAKQDKELQELQSRQEAEKRAAEESTRRTAEQEKEIAQRQSLPSDIAAALAPPSLSANARKKQGNAIADLINSTPFKDMFGVISLPSGLESALRNGHEKAINTARDILSRRGVRPVEWTQQEAEIISEDTETPAPYEPPQQTVGRHEETVITHETPDRPPQIELDSALTAEPVAHDKAKRKRQGEAIHRVINSPQFIAAYGRVKLPAALESTLQRGEYKAIETVQRMLRERGIIPQPEAQPIQETQPEQATKPKEETNNVPLKETLPETESTSAEEKAREAEEREARKAELAEEEEEVLDGMDRKRDQDWLSETDDENTEWVIDERERLDNARKAEEEKARDERVAKLEEEEARDAESERLDSRMDDAEALEELFAEENERTEPQEEPPAEPKGEPPKEKQETKPATEEEKPTPQKFAAELDEIENNAKSGGIDPQTAMYAITHFASALKKNLAKLLPLNKYPKTYAEAFNRIDDMLLDGMKGLNGRSKNKKDPAGSIRDFRKFAEETFNAIHRAANAQVERRERDLEQKTPNKQYAPSEKISEEEVFSDEQGTEKEPSKEVQKLADKLKKLLDDRLGLKKSFPDGRARLFSTIDKAARRAGDDVSEFKKFARSLLDDANSGQLKAQLERDEAAPSKRTSSPKPKKDPQAAEKIKTRADKLKADIEKKFPQLSRYPHVKADIFNDIDQAVEVATKAQDATRFNSFASNYLDTWNGLKKVMSEKTLEQWFKQREDSLTKQETSNETEEQEEPEEQDAPHKIPKAKSRRDQVTEADVQSLVDQAWNSGMRAELEYIRQQTEPLFWRAPNAPPEDVYRIIYDRMRDLFKARAANDKKTARNKPAPQKLADCENIDDVEAYWRSKHNPKIIFDPKLKKLYFPAVKEFLQGAEETFSLFPDMHSRLSYVTCSPMSQTTAKASLSPVRQTIALTISSKMFADETAVENLRELYKENVDHYHPDNTTIEGTGAHEVGHLIEQALIRRAGMVIQNDRAYEFANEKLVSWAGKLLRGSQTGIEFYRKLRTARKKISEYATTDLGETISEAISDVHDNGKNAKPLSHAIIQRINEAIRGDTWREALIIDDKNPGAVFRNNVNTATAAKWYAARRAKGDIPLSTARVIVQALLYDTALSKELSQCEPSEWEKLLESKTPDEKILESGKWTDEVINEYAKDSSIAHMIQYLGGTITDGKVQLNAKGRKQLENCIEMVLDPNSRYSYEGEPANFDMTNIVAPEKLSGAQKLLQQFADKLGVKTVFFDNPDGRFHGAFSEGVTFLNVNSKKGLGGVFWHESFHWLKANNPQLYAKLVDAAGITDKDRQAFLDRTGRKDVKTNEEIDEEILADQMDDVAKRTGLLQSIAGKNRGVVERVVQWLKDTMNKFIETFRNPTGRLTTKQAQALANEFGRIARQLKDENGEQIFRVNNRTGDIEVVEGHKARELSREEIEAAAKSPNAKYSVSDTIKNFASTVFSGKPQSKNHKQFIVDKLEELTRYKTYFNTNAKNEADVVIDSFQKIIRARHAYDFEKLLPATGEPIAKVLGLNPSAEMSNYIADWMMTGAINNTSKEATAFQKAMRAHPAEAELLQSIRDTFQEMANMTAEEAVESNIVRGKKSKTFREWLGEKFSKEEWVDDLHPIKRAYDQMLAKAPPAVADIIKKNFDPYMSASLFRGKGAITDMMIGDKKEVTAEDIDVVRRVLQHEFPNVNFSNFKPLAAIAKMVDYDVEGLERYALAKLDKEMHEKKNSGDAKYSDLTPSYTEAQCDEIIKAGKAKYDAAQRALVDYSNTLTAIQYSTGVISANQFYQRVNGWKNYVPTARVFEEYEDISVDKSDSSKHKTGSKRRVYAPLGKLEYNTNLFIRQALQNRARLEIVTMARLGNFGDIVAETPKGYPHGHTIHFKENGKMKYLVTPDESLARAVEAIQTPADANIVVQAFKTAGMVMRGLYTMFNAEFAAGNPFRDLADAFIHNKYGSRNPFVAIPAMVSAAVSGFAQSVGAQIKSEEFRTFLAEGGAQSGFSYEITEGASKRVNSFGKKSLAKSTWDKFIMIAEASENMTRFSTFKTAKDNLAKQHGGVPTPHDLKLAAMQARRATVDFARAGHTMRGVNKVALFSNAAMQSLALWGEKINAFRKGKEGAGKELFAAVFKTVMSGVMPALALAALNFSDDDRRKRFEQRPTWEKDTYWIFGDGLRVPKGMDLGIKLTSALTEEFAMWLASNKPVEWKRIVNNIGRGLPSITTTIFTPALETYMNYSIFKDAPIVPYGQKDDPKYKQYGKNTSWFAKWLGKTFNQSPRVIDHLIAGYGGSMATALTGGSDGIPIVRRFLFNPDKNPRIVQDYYKALEEQEEMFAEYKARRADGEKVELPEDYDRGLHARLKNSSKAMSNISKAEMRIMDDPKLDADKRKEKLRELEKRRVALCERVLGKAR